MTYPVEAELDLGRAITATQRTADLVTARIGGHRP